MSHVTASYRPCIAAFAVGACAAANGLNNNANNNTHIDGWAGV
ncbi:MAG: hypothetical protein WA777_16860 [Rhodanobacter sp.]